MSRVKVLSFPIQIESDNIISLDHEKKAIFHTKTFSIENVITQEPEQCVSAELATLEIHSLNVDSNLAPPAPVVSMLSVVPMAG